MSQKCKEGGIKTMYDLIYADPPWQYRIWDLASQHYETMTLEDLKRLPVENLAKKDSVLLMWVTLPNIPQALELMEAWGFEYKTVAFVWIKQNKNNDDFFMGRGYYTRSNAELCFLGKRGRGLKRRSRSVRQLIISRRRRHSEKPDEAYERIDELFGTDIRRIELFARKKMDGWDVWGNEVESDIDVNGEYFPSALS